MCKDLYVLCSARWSGWTWQSPFWILAFGCRVALNCHNTSQNACHGCEKRKKSILVKVFIFICTCLWCTNCSNTYCISEQQVFCITFKISSCEFSVELNFLFKCPFKNQKCNSICLFQIQNCSFYIIIIIAFNCNCRFRFTLSGVWLIVQE